LFEPGLVSRIFKSSSLEAIAKSTFTDRKVIAPAIAIIANSIDGTLVFIAIK
jgi:hypothetical protein